MEIIATFVPDPGGDAAAELARPPAGATSVELRADLLDPDGDLASLIAACPVPVVLTLRSRAEGGKGPDDPTLRRRFFQRASAWPVAFFDLEAARDEVLLDDPVPRERAILSIHFAGTPADLEEQSSAMLARGTRLVKVVPRADTLADVLATLSLAQAFDRGERAGRRAVVFASGDAGRATRLMGPLLGAPVAYAAWSRERSAAPGQFTPGDMLALVGHLAGRPRRVFGILGRATAGSLSPWMHAAAYRAVGLPSVFVPLEVGEEGELDRLIGPAGETALDDLGLAVGGYAVTMPWKEAAARRCTLLAPRAERARAANTVLPRLDKVLGDCTDIDGITAVLREHGVTAAGRRALVLGSGSAARAAAVALSMAGARVAVSARREESAKAAARELGLAVATPESMETAMVAVNATPAGADGESGEILDRLRMPRGAVVVDLPYGPAPTALERLSTARGWHYVGGREVLLFQGIAQFAAMNSVAPPVRAMAAAIGLEEVQG